MAYISSLLLGSAVVVAALLRYAPPYFSAGAGAWILGWLLYAAFRIFVYPFYLSPLRHLPEPAGAAGFPWAHADALRKQHNGAPLRAWADSTPNEGIVRFRVLFNQERLLLTSPAALKEFLVTRSGDFERVRQVNYIFQQLLGDGLLSAEGPAHKRQRKALNPAFSYRHIKDLYPVFWDKARHAGNEIARAIQRDAPSGTEPSVQNTYNWANRTSLDIIGVAAMGQDFDAVSNPHSETVQIYEQLFRNEPPHLRWTVMGLFAPVGILFRTPLPMIKDAKAAANAVRGLGYRALEKKRARAAAGKDGDVDILSIAMRSGEFTDAELVDQMMTFLAAGHETTASTLTWAIYLLCQHPEVQTRLRAEIRAELPSVRDASSTVSAAQIDALPYLHAVCNEVLRFIPAVPMTIRDAAFDTTIQGQHIPKGTRIFVAPWATNVSTDLWGESATHFDPDRWLAPGMANVGGAPNNFAHMTFSHGPKSCIGKDFARGEFLCLLAAWIGRFQVRWIEGKPLPMDVKGWVTVRPEHGLPVVFEEVEGW